MYLRINESNPNQSEIDLAVKCLEQGGVIIYPTDTIYGLGCDIFNQKAMDKLCRLKGLKPKEANFSIICHDLKHISDYTLPFDTKVYKTMKKNLPGPFTFILRANGSIPKLFKNKKKTIGIRIPDNNIVREIVRQLGRPIATTSIKNVEENAVNEHPTDPDEIRRQYEDKVDLIIDGGYGNFDPSTVVDCSTETIEIIRQGSGELIY